MKKNSFLRIWSKIALLLVIIGFCMPVVSHQGGIVDYNGFQILPDWFGFGGFYLSEMFLSLVMLLTFLSAAVSILYTIILLIAKKNINSKSATICDTIFLLLSIIGGIIMLIFCITEEGLDDLMLRQAPYIKISFTLLFLGWIISGVLLICSAVKLESNTSV